MTSQILCDVTTALYRKLKLAVQAVYVQITMTVPFICVNKMTGGFYYYNIISKVLLSCFGALYTKLLQSRAGLIYMFRKKHKRVYEARMRPALNRSSAIRCFECSDAIEMRNVIIFVFYTGLPHMRIK